MSTGNPLVPTDPKGSPTPTPYVLIPYSATDIGVRPLPNSTVLWMCHSIHVNGLPYTGVPFEPGETVNLSVIVKNAGAVGTLAEVQLYSNKPGTVFSKSSLNLIGQSLLYVPALSQQETPSLPWVITSALPIHVCLLAVVSCPLDPAPAIAIPLHDRHFGQQNVKVKTANSLLSHFSFHVANAGSESAHFHVRARPVSDEALRQLNEFYKAEGVSLKSESIALAVAEPGRAGRSRQELRLELKPEEKRLCQVFVDVPPNLGADQFFAVEIEQAAEKTDTGRAATLGFIVFGAEKE